MTSTSSESSDQINSESSDDDADRVPLRSPRLRNRSIGSPMADSYRLHRKRKRASNQANNSTSKKKRRINEQDNVGTGLNFDKAINYLIANNANSDELKEENERLKRQISQSQNQHKEMMRKQKIQKDEIQELRAKLSTERAKWNQRMSALQTKHSKEKSKWSKQMEALQRRRDVLRSNLDIYEGKSEQINAMSIKELNAFESKLQGTMQSVQTAKEKLFECIVCQDSPRNVIFVGCGHCVLCEQCERQMNDKKCPRCEAPYTAIHKCVL